jgi:hypothetical protein
MDSVRKLLDTPSYAEYDALSYVLTSGVGRCVRYLLENVQIRGDSLDRRPETREARSKQGSKHPEL